MAQREFDPASWRPEWDPSFKFREGGWRVDMDKLNRRRIEMHLSKMTVCRLAGYVSNGTWAWSQCAKAATVEAVYRIAKVLDLRIEEVLVRDGDDG